MRYPSHNGGNEAEAVWLCEPVNIKSPLDLFKETLYATLAFLVTFFFIYTLTYFSK
jgi:hypothetical protein